MQRISILGDSISTFEGMNPEGFLVYYQGERCQATGVLDVADTWWAQVAERLGATVLANGSYSGSLVEGAGFPAGSSERRIAALAADGTAPDAVIVFMGINDYGWGGAAAQAAGRGNALPETLDLDAIEQRTAGSAPAEAARLFSDAYGLLLDRIAEAYPHAQTTCCTLCPGRVAGSSRPTFAFNLRGVPFDAYNDAIRAQARAHGCRVADVRAQGFDYEAVDGTHPTARGMRQLAQLVLRSLGETDAAQADDPAAEGLFDEALRSEEICPDRSCIGCAHARSTGSKWLLVCDKDPS